MIKQVSTAARIVSTKNLNFIENITKILPYKNTLNLRIPHFCLRIYYFSMYIFKNSNTGTKNERDRIN